MSSDLAPSIVADPGYHSDCSELVDFGDGEAFDDVESKIASEFNKRGAAVDGACMVAE